MRRHRRYEVDGRLKLKAGDIVTLTRAAREGIMRNYPVIILSGTTAIVKKIQYDISEKKFFVVIELLGQDFWMTIGDLKYVGENK